MLKGAVVFTFNFRFGRNEDEPDAICPVDNEDVPVEVKVVEPNDSTSSAIS
jgi:hypothetical protein